LPYGSRLAWPRCLSAEEEARRRDREEMARRRASRRKNGMSKLDRFGMNSSATSYNRLAGPPSFGSLSLSCRSAWVRGKFGSVVGDEHVVISSPLREATVILEPRQPVTVGDLGPCFVQRHPRIEPLTGKSSGEMHC